jgi:hypothetical protein
VIALLYLLLLIVSLDLGRLCERGFSMRGQWLRTYSGTNSGTVTVDVDEVGNRFRGCAYLFEGKPSVPDIRAEINVAKPASGNIIKARLTLMPLIRNTGQVNSWAAPASNYPAGTIFPNTPTYKYPKRRHN